MNAWGWGILISLGVVACVAARSAADQTASCSGKLFQIEFSEKTCKAAQAQADVLVRTDEDCKATFPNGVNLCAKVGKDAGLADVHE